MQSPAKSHRPAPLGMLPSRHLFLFLFLLAASCNLWCTGSPLDVPSQTLCFALPGSYSAAVAPHCRLRPSTSFRAPRVSERVIAVRALSGNNAVRSSNSQPGGGSIEFVESSIEVSASVEECFQVASGFEDYVKWAESVPKVEVLEKNEQGLGERVALRLGALGFTLDYVLMYEYDQPRQMRWNAVGGKVTTPLGTVVPFEGANDNGSSQLIGSYTFEEVRPGLFLCLPTCARRRVLTWSMEVPGVTKVVYKLAIEYGFPFPKAVKEQ
eukprot:2305085-Rhodomonas_salina.2